MLLMFAKLPNKEKIKFSSGVGNKITTPYGRVAIKKRAPSKELAMVFAILHIFNAAIDGYPHYLITTSRLHIAQLFVLELKPVASCTV